jgi:hypothetical protein
VGLCTARDVSTTITFAAGTNVGNGEVLNWTGGNQPLARVGGNGVTIDGYVFSGSGIYAEGVSGLTIKNCVFQNSKFHQWAADDGIFYNGLTDSSVTHCKFQAWYGDAGIFGYNPLRCHFDDNAFEDVTEGMHFNWGQTAVPCNSTILRNAFNHTHRYALEMQGAISGLDVGFNWAENFTPANHATMAYSLPLTGQPGGGVVGYSNGVHVHHNYAGGTGLVPGPVANGDQSWGFELGGRDTEFDHNLVNGAFLVCVTATGTSNAWNPHDNVFAGHRGKVFDYEYAGTAPATAANNQDLPNMVAVPAAAAVTSGAFWVVNGAGAPSPPVAPAAPATVHPVANAGGTISVSWSGPGPMYCRGSAPADKVTFPGATSPQVIRNLPDGWVVFVGDGSTEASVTVAGSLLPPTAPFAPVLTPPPPVATPPVATAPATRPAAAPSVVHTIEVMSDGSVSVH